MIELPEAWHAWYTIGVIVVLIVALFRDVARPDIIILGGLGLILVAGIIPPEAAFAGFANPAVLAIAALFVVAGGIEQTNGIKALDRLIFVPRENPHRGLPRLMMVTSLLSGFMNNTPIVAMFIPRVKHWAESSGWPASKALIPLSYAAIVGGLITLIGTSTNIVVSGLIQEAGYEPLGMFDLTWVGVPVMIVVALFMAFVGHRLLPSGSPVQKKGAGGLDDCLFEVKVEDRSPLIGLTIEQAELRALEDTYLAHIRRRKRLIQANPAFTLRAGDVLVFIGQSSQRDSLLERPGLTRPLEVDENGEDSDLTFPLYEAVIAPSSELVGQTLKQAAFRERYGGVVIAIKRRDQQTSQALGQIELQPGDLLLIEASSDFEARWANKRNEFYLVSSQRTGQTKKRPHKAPIALLIMAGMVTLVALGLLPLATASFAAALGIIVTRCLRVSEARQAVDVSVLVVIAASLGLGKAVEATGLAAGLAQVLVEVSSGLGPFAILAALYLTTNILTELISNAAAAALMVPVALTAALDLGYDPKAFALIVAVGASASFITPIGYQTNLMVMSAGGYRFSDYTKVGVPVSLLVMVVTVLVVRYVWL